MACVLDYEWEKIIRDPDTPTEQPRTTQSGRTLDKIDSVDASTTGGQQDDIMEADTERDDTAVMTEVGDSI